MTRYVVVYDAVYNNKYHNLGLSHKQKVFWLIFFRIFLIIPENNPCFHPTPVQYNASYASQVKKHNLTRHK